MYIWSLLLPLVFCSPDSLTGIWMMQALLNASAQIKVRENVILTTFWGEISFTIERSIVYRAFLNTCFRLFKLKCLKQIYSSFLRQPLLYHTFASCYHQTLNNTCISNGCFFLHEDCKEGMHQVYSCPFSACLSTQLSP